MRIHGFQKMTLLDFPGRMACTVFTAGCNLRCPFCHNAFLVTKIDLTESMDPAEILAYMRTRVGVLDGVCVTGGEPLLYPDTPDFLAQIKQLGLAVKLDTNGTFPDRLREVVERGLVDYVAMDIKNAPDKYAETVGIPAFDLTPVKQSVAFLQQGQVDYEFRTTVVREFHTVADIEAVGRWIAGAPRYFLQGFVDSGELIGHGLHGVERAEMQKMQAAAAEFVRQVDLRGVE